MDLRLRFEKGLAPSLLALPDPALARVVERLGGRPVTRGVPLDLRASLLMHLDRRLHVPLERLSVEAARREASRRLAVTLGPTPSGVVVEERQLPHPELREGVRVLVHQPRLGRPGPLVVYFHQGGFVLGEPSWTTPFAGILVGTLGARVVSVAYPRAPERFLPRIQQAARWAIEAIRHELGAPRRWAIGGDSAGAHLAAWLGQVLPEAEKPSAQLLVYPLLDFLGVTRSRTELAHAHPVSTAFLNWARAQAVPTGLDPADPDVSPGLRARLERCPPAVVVTAGFDPLLDEGEAYARRLEDAGVRVRHRSFLDLPHGFTGLAGAVPAAGDALRTIARDLGVFLDTSTARREL